MGTGLLDENGFDPKRLADVVADLQEAFRAEFGESVNLGPSTILGKLVSTYADRETTLWERIEAAYNAAYPGTASGVSLDRVAEITAVTRNPATRSTTALYVRGATVTIKARSIVETSDTAIQFRTIAEVVLGAAQDLPITSGTADLAINSITRASTVATVTTTVAHGLTTGEIATISGVTGPTGADATLYNVTAEITVTGASTFTYNMTGTPSNTATGTPVYIDEGLATDHITFATIVVRSVAHGLSTDDVVFVHDANEDGYNQVATITILDVDHFEYTPVIAPTATPATGSYNGDVAILVQGESVDTGGVIGLAQNITVITNPISGWNGAGNIADATLGDDEETDAAFRIRRIAALAGLGNATVEAIRGALLAVTNVDVALIFPNDSDIIDSGGRPPHSFESVVQNGADQDVIDEIFLNKAAGIGTFGTESGTSIDSQNNAHAINFSRPSEVTIWLDLTLTTNSDYPVDGDALVEAAVLAFGAALDIGDDVIVFPQLVGAIDGIPGITDVVVDIGIADPPSGDANITIAETEISTWDSARIDIL